MLISYNKGLFWSDYTSKSQSGKSQIYETFTNITFIVLNGLTLQGTLRTSPTDNI